MGRTEIIAALFCDCGCILKDDKYGQELWFWQHRNVRGCSEHPKKGWHVKDA
jgi:hypothetical protein